MTSITFRYKAKRWYVSAAWEKEIADPLKSTFPSVGIDNDRGVAVFAAFSDGRRYKLNAFEKIRDKLTKVQRQLARKVKQSSNWKKLRGKIFRLRHKANARKDYPHTTEIAQNHGISRETARAEYVGKCERHG